MSSRVQRSRRRKSTPSRAATEFQRKFIRAFLLLIGITLVIIFIFGDHGVYQLVRLKQERKVTQTAITQLREERKQLEDEKYKLQDELEKQVKDFNENVKEIGEAKEKEINTI